MIPRAYLDAWTERAPWPDLRQVEQDLIISRALCDLFNAPALREAIAFRGGTAIHKLLFQTPRRYSEDIDLVQLVPAPIGPTIDAVRDALGWLGKCRREQAGHSVHLTFRFSPEADLQSSLKLKVEINTREHQSLLGVRRYEMRGRQHSRLLEFLGLLINGEHQPMPLPRAPLREVLSTSRPLFGTEVLECRMPGPIRNSVGEAV